jgi:hypothetical protein
MTKRVCDADTADTEQLQRGNTRMRWVIVDRLLGH